MSSSKKENMTCMEILSQDSVTREDVKTALLKIDEMKDEEDICDYLCIVATKRLIKDDDEELVRMYLNNIERMEFDTYRARAARYFMENSGSSDNIRRAFFAGSDGARVVHVRALEDTMKMRFGRR
ncbi:MAG: hypothetical protein ACLFOC_09275 [Campylobacterales bacterium]